MQKRKHITKRFKTSKAMDHELENMDLSSLITEKGRIVKPKIRKVNLDLPENVIEVIDVIAVKMGVSRQPLIKIWIHEMIQKELLKNRQIRLG